MSLSARRAWIEIRSIVYNSASGWSLSARRAWIEISCGVYNMERLPVALRKESVDRNYNAPHIIDAVCVALRKESVDRNV